MVGFTSPVPRVIFVPLPITLSANVKQPVTRHYEGYIMNLVCQGAGGLGGQDWDGPHLLVGRLVLGHTARGEVVGGVDRSLSGQRGVPRQPVCWVRPHPGFLDHVR